MFFAISQAVSSQDRARGEFMALHDLGRLEESETIFGEFRLRPEVEDVVAEIYAWSGDADAAFEWLDKMYDKYRSVPVPLPQEPLLRNLHGDPRWNEFLERVGKSPEQLAAIKFDPKLPGQ